MKQKKIRVLKVEPNKIPEVVELINDLDSLQKAISVGTEYQGLIEIINLESDVCLLCNEEGKLNGMKGNRRLGNDIICGVFYIVGSDKHGNLCSLTEQQIIFYNAMFAEPETFTDIEIESSMFFEITDLED